MTSHWPSFLCDKSSFYMEKNLENSDMYPRYEQFMYDCPPKISWYDKYASTILQIPNMFFLAALSDTSNVSVENSQLLYILTCEQAP